NQSLLRGVCHWRLQVLHHGVQRSEPRLFLRQFFPESVEPATRYAHVPGHREPELLAKLLTLLNGTEPSAGPRFSTGSGPSYLGTFSRLKHRDSVLTRSPPAIKKPGSAICNLHTDFHLGGRV